jgi:hypothetical protein
MLQLLFSSTERAGSAAAAAAAGAGVLLPPAGWYGSLVERGMRPYKDVTMAEEDKAVRRRVNH